MRISPFDRGYRASGVLLHLTSLPSRDGIGDAGPGAREWIDMLKRTGQRWWQVLPLGPPGYGNCPYQQSTALGRNGQLISLEQLVDFGLLTPAEYQPPAFRESKVDFDAVAAFKTVRMDAAWTRFQDSGEATLRSEFEAFCQQQSDWLPDYALFECLKLQFGTGQFQRWPEGLAKRQDAALKKAQCELRDQMDRIQFEQFLVFRQLQELKAYATSQGIVLVGDLPYFVALDSCDVWAHPENFLLNEKLFPIEVSGVPPDYFSPSGQLWGHPQYRWSQMRETNYDWWLKRIQNLLEHVHVIRLDHFRAFAAAWHVPARAKTAKNGTWRPGPGAELLNLFRTKLGDLPFIAEDLGLITPDVVALKDQFEMPGMRVLQFAFDGDENNPFLPEHYTHNSIAYTGTHDNDTTRGWFESLPEVTRKTVLKLLEQHRAHSVPVSEGMLRVVWESSAAVAIAPAQDLLDLGSDCRMNTPGQSKNNWAWRCPRSIYSDPALEKLARVTAEAGRDRSE